MTTRYTGRQKTRDIILRNNTTWTEKKRNITIIAPIGKCTATVYLEVVHDACILLFLQKPL